MKPHVPFGSSLRARVMIGVLVPLIVVLGIAAFVQFLGHRQLLLDNLDRVSLSVGDGIEASLSRAMLSRDSAQLAKVAQNLGTRALIRNFMILDTRGNVRIASRVSDVGTNLPLGNPTCQVCHQSAVTDSGRSIVMAMADGSRVFRNVTPIRNAPECQTCHGTAAKLNGILVIDLPYDAVEANLWTDLRDNVLVALAAIILVAIVINLLLSRLVVARLEGFGEALMRFARGDFDARLPVSGNDEISRLGRTMNVMALGLGEKAHLEQKVEQTARELQVKSSRLGTLYRVALESSRSLDLEQVMRVGLVNALEVMNMKAGAIFLLGPGGNNLWLRASSGTEEGFARQENVIRNGDCICGRAAVLGQTCAIRDLASDPRVTRSACLDHGYRAVAAVPLKARGRPLGVLTLHADNPRGVTDEETALLSALGDQLGMAIDNAILYAEMESRVRVLTRQLGHLAVIQERVRLGREMHDGLAQTLSTLNLKLRLAESGGNGHVAAALAEMREIVDAAYEDVRQAIGDLRMSPSPDVGIVATLVEYAQSFAIRYDLEAQFMVEPEAAQARCSPDVQVQVVRIVQEALANVRKHAEAKHLYVLFERVDGALRIQLRDDGRGMAPRKAGGREHFGLSIMRERAATYKGDLRIHSRPEEGTCVELTVPVEGE